MIAALFVMPRGCYVGLDGIKTGACQRLSANQRKATPPEFRDLLISIAHTAAPARAAA